MGMGGLAMMGAGLFLITWLVMMVAMMFPSVAPMTLAFASVSRSRGEGTLPIAAFVLGYLVVWTAVGLVPLVVLLAAIVPPLLQLLVALMVGFVVIALFMPLIELLNKLS